MLIRNNRGEVTAEFNTGLTQDGTRITSSTLYDPQGNPAMQNVTIRRSDGTVDTTNVIGRKIIP
jgi:hypothetical protein